MIYKNRFIIFVLIIGCIECIDYYVHPTNGNDANSGLTNSQPFKTLNKAREEIYNKDGSIILNAGFYEWNTPNLDFKSPNELTIKSISSSVVPTIAIANITVNGKSDCQSWFDLRSPITTINGIRIISYANESVCNFFILNRLSLTLVNVQFDNIFAKYIIYSQEKLNIRGSAFNNIRISDYYLIYSSGDIKIDNTTFVNITGNYYAQVYSDSINITNSKFKQNVANVHILYSTNKVVLDNCEFSNNPGTYVVRTKNLIANKVSVLSSGIVQADVSSTISNSFFNLLNSNAIYLQQESDGIHNVFNCEFKGYQTAIKYESSLAKNAYLYANNITISGHNGVNLMQVSNGWLKLNNSFISNNTLVGGISMANARVDVYRTRFQYNTAAAGSGSVFTCLSSNLTVLSSQSQGNVNEFVDKGGCRTNQNGYTTGITTGRTTGITSGITTKSMSTGRITTGITTGQTTGRTTGITTGQTTGRTTGITTGQTTGRTTGYTTGITTGLTSQSISTGVTTDEISTGMTSIDISTGLTSNDITSSEITTQQIITSENCGEFEGDLAYFCDESQNGFYQCVKQDLNIREDHYNCAEKTKCYCGNGVNCGIQSPCTSEKSELSNTSKAAIGILVPLSVIGMITCVGILIKKKRDDMIEKDNQEINLDQIQ